jgi:SM-20-related protein
MTTSTHPSLVKREIEGKPLFLIDDLFDADFIKLFDYFVKRLPFSLADYDVEDSSNVLHWIHEFSLEDVATHPLLSVVYFRIRSAAELAYPKPRIELKRVHCNTSLYGDLQLPHHDIRPGVTWLYYTNPDWQINWMGETIFYDSSAEPIYAVFPKPGRVVVFSADILHRAGVPSRDCVEARRSIAFKFAEREDKDLT